jgi:hypothetical protein
MSRYGFYGRPVLLLEAYKDWREERLLQEADSKADFPSFLFGPVRQSLWQGYEYVQGQYQRYARIENAPDFRERRLRGLTGFLSPGYVGDHGDYPMVARKERNSVSLVVDTYGAMYEITRQAIINDDTQELLNSAPAAIGDSMANFIVETVIALIESNPTAADGFPMFDSTHRTYINSATNPLSEDALATALASMTKQVDDIGRRIRVMPQVLAVGDPHVQLEANRILNSQLTGTVVQFAGGTAGAGAGFMDKGTLNPLNGILPGDAVVYDPFFTSAHTWYLFADATKVPGFAVGFLNGNQMPQVFLHEAIARDALGGNGSDPYGWELDAVRFKCRVDFGVAAVDYRGVYRSVVP